MPCNSDYMEANPAELEMSRVACCEDELAGLRTKAAWWDGYHPRIYCNLPKKEVRDAMVHNLCEKLQSLSTEELATYSLELQMWWRDHIRADRERVEREMREAKDAEDRAALLSRLSPHERRLLGINPGTTPR
jgi:hypothetical protein